MQPFNEIPIFIVAVKDAEFLKFVKMYETNN